MIKNKTIRQIIVLILLITGFSSYAQVATDTTDFPKVRNLVSFYNFMLNNIGAAKSTTRDKEVMITESYKKIFASPEVQIEDDLALDRKVITNKEVSAYLRDVDFFFKDIKFSFIDVQIQKLVKDDGSDYFVVSFENKIVGTTLDGEAYNSLKKRFIEVNLGKLTNDLKIVSIYSTKISRERELKIWGESLSYAWLEIFKQQVPFDSLTKSVLMKLSDLENLNLSGNQLIVDLEPLSALRNLKYLDISQTKVTDISPLRYSRGLQQLNASNTPVENISTLQYFTQLQTLDLSHTEIIEISVLSQLNQLARLNLSNTQIIPFEPLSNLSGLKEINLSSTGFSNIDILTFSFSTLEKCNFSRCAVTQLNSCKAMKALKELNISESKVTRLEGLDGHPTLEAITINLTKITSLDPLLNLPKLKKVYADNSDITEKVAIDFMTKKPKTIVITNSQQLLEWWKSLSDNWKKVFQEVIKIQNPEKEDIIRFLNVDTLLIANKNLALSDPLKQFKRLKYLDISQNKFTSFSFCENMQSLESLVANGLTNSNTSGLEKCVKLRFLKLNDCALVDIGSLSSLNKLELIEMDRTKVDEAQIINYLRSNPKTVVIYQTEALKSWWDGLTQLWKDVFKLNEVNSYQLHQLIEQREMKISNLNVTSLSPLSKFVNLEKITLDRVSMTNLDELYRHSNLKQLTCTNGPLETLRGITRLTELESLDISNTAIGNLKELEGLQSLKQLNCSGTSVLFFNGITEIKTLEVLDVSNTRVLTLKGIYELKNLKKLICNNTKLWKSAVEDFRNTFPSCEVTFY